MMEKEEGQSSFLITCMRCSNILRDHHVGRKVSAREINTTDIVEGKTVTSIEAIESKT